MGRFIILAAVVAAVAAAQEGAVGFVGVGPWAGSPAGGGAVGLGALGAWVRDLGAPLDASGAGLPPTDLLAPPRRLALFVAPSTAGASGVAGLQAPAALAGGDAGALGSALRRAGGVGGRSAGVGCAAAVDAEGLCGAWHRPVDADAARARAAVARHPLADAVANGGGGVSRARDGNVKRIRGDAAAAWLDTTRPANAAFLGEAAAFAELAAEPSAGAPRVDVYYASALRNVDAADHPAALAVLRALARGAAATAAEVVAVAVLPPGPERRRLSATPAPTPAPDDATYYDLDEIKAFQINLWTGVGLILAVGSAVGALATMKPEYDSLLYATFQANVDPVGTKFE